MLILGLWVSLIGHDCGKTIEEMNLELFQKNLTKKREEELVDLRREVHILKRWIEMVQWKEKNER